ncbi:MAG TPA: VOC family protein [Candidatus Binatia bacterium]|jgi:PhnB protein|nr:VOC family protein [Candidatus Binatia bacterium]
MSAKPIPEGFHTVTPYLTVTDAARQIEFLEKAFNARVKFKMENEGGEIRHAEVQVGDSMLMIGQAGGPWQPMPTNFYLYVPDCDALYRSALAAGAKTLQEPANQFYGDRMGGVEDSQGNKWWIGTHVEDVSEEEMERRMKAMAH